MNLTANGAPYGALTNPTRPLIDPSALGMCHPCARLEEELAEKNAEFAKIAADYSAINSRLTKVTLGLNRASDAIDELPQARGYSALQVGGIIIGTVAATLTGVFWAYIGCCNLRG